jgi:hypothetical protein
MRTYKCLKAFEGVTTRANARRVDNNSKPPTTKSATQLITEWFLNEYKDFS